MRQFRLMASISSMERPVISGLDRTLYIASLHSGRMEIKDLYGFERFVGMSPQPPEYPFNI
jgi:hypothetical protein